MGKEDGELAGLMNKLYSIQEEVGGKEEVKTKATKNSASKDKASRFQDLKATIVDRLKTVQQLMKDAHEKEKAMVGGFANPKEKIAAQQTMRENIRQLGEEWKELDALYKSEAKKKRSKFSKDELQAQQTLVIKLQQEIEKVKEVQRSAFRGAAGNTAPSGYQTSQYAPTAPGMSKNNKPVGASWASSDNNAASLTNEQKEQIQELQERDQDFDRQIEAIEMGITDLAEIAELQNEEVKRQNVMLENTKNKIDAVHEKVVTVNAKLKNTLNEVARPGDKLCVDIMCIVFAVGFGAVIYKFITG
eukprot:CAMPEP_0196804910 /NCGR_PEP_ID=MMETSP1362-20130617/4601_1 /TAXON_ID=163516 /ORGANISM="Leptocylindrus danicus, Strain CCMP1856" /LENGTH=302 /DNA_ID=CAMNT_0042177497 /DNA_START=48 /DNA_END=956 /DNA_ORIENTATION=-